MDKRKAYKLARALESNKYKQGVGFLKRDDGTFCCLGVACEISGIKPILKNKTFHYNSLDTSLDKTARKMTGFETGVGSFKYKILVKRKSGELEYFASLAQMNDQGLSFKFIAKILRKHYVNIV